MSDYIADARVRVLPDLSQFTTELTKDLNKQITKFNATSAKSLKPIQVPVAAGAISKAQMTGVAASAAQANKALSKTSASSQAVTANFAKMNAAGRKSTATLLGAGTATARLDAALLGLRTAIGSTAVIGLGAAALAAIALGKAIRSTFGITVAYERELNVFQAVTGASADEMTRVAAAAKALGADITLPAVSAADAAVAMSELAKAGLSVQDAIDGARGVLQLATAANIGFADAVELAASALNAFQLTGRDAVKVADTLANAANLAQGSITDIGLSLSQSAAIGRQAGLTFQDTTAFLTLLAQAGLKGSDAGTSLRTALIRLINPTAKAAAIIEELGVSIRDEAGNIRPDVFIQFANAMRGMSAEARDAKLAVIGGQDALRAFAILGRTSTKDFLALRAELRKQGTAADVAAARTKGLGGSMQALQSTLETVGITLGQKVAPGFTDFINGVTASVSALSESEGVAAAFSGAMTGVATALNAVGAALTLVGPPLLFMTNLLSKVPSGIGSSFVTSILAAVVALKAFSFAMKATATTRAFAALQIEVATVMRQIEIELGLATTGITTFQRALIGTRAVFAGVLSSFNIWVAAIVATGAALVYLSTRESGLEKATKALKKATDELVTSQNAAKAAAAGVAAAMRTAETSQLAVDQANLARETAAAALANSNAAAGSIQRRQLEINLAVAIQNVGFATQDAKKATEDLITAQQEAEAAALKAKAAMDQEVGTLLQLALAADLEDKFTRPSNFGADILGAITDFVGITDTTTALEALNNKIRDVAAEYRVAGDAASVWRGKQLAAIASVQSAIGEKLTPIQWRKILASKDLETLTKRIRAILQTAGIEGGDALVVGILQQARLLPRGIADSISAAGIAADRQAQIVGRNLGTSMANATNKAFAGTLDISTQILAAELKGGAAGGLAVALKEQAKAQKAFDAIFAATAGGTKFRNDQQRKDFKERAERLDKANDEVKRLQGEIDSAQQEQVRLAEDAKTKADQAAQDLFTALTESGRARTLNRQLERAGLTPGLKDDIKFTKALIAYFKRIQENLRKRLAALGASSKVINEIMRSINDTLFQLGLDLQRLAKEQQDAIEAQNAAVQDALMTKINAQIRFFEIKGNVAGQIKAHRAKLAAITKELVRLKNQGKKNTAAWWDLKAQQAEEQKAINELKKQTKERNNAAAQLMFTFLQTQQGFAANLLGNLIGLGATGGLVGNVSPTGAATPTAVSTFGLRASSGRAINPEADLVAQGQVAAGARLGVSRGQGSTQVELLRSILQALNDIKRGAGFPGAQYQRRQASAAMDTGGGGGGFQAA